MELEGIMLSEVRQKKKDKHHMWNTKKENKGTYKTKLKQSTET